MTVTNYEKMSSAFGTWKGARGKEILDLHQTAIKRMRIKEDATAEKLMGKYILLQIGGKNRFFKIVKVNKCGTEYPIEKICDTQGWDARLIGGVNDEGHSVLVFDFRKHSMTGDNDNSSDQYARMIIEGYGIKQEISVLFKDISEILDLSWRQGFFHAL